MNEDKPLHAEIIFNVLLIIALLVLLGMVFLVTKSDTFNINRIKTDISENTYNTAQRNAISSNKNKILTRVSSPTALTDVEKDQIFDMIGGKKVRAYSFSEAEWAILVDKFNK